LGGFGANYLASLYSDNRKIIANSSELKSIITNLSQEKIISFDTEFIRHKTYWPVLCSIQMHTKNNSILIDTLSTEINLEPLKVILSDKKILKIFHAHTQDLEILNNELNIKISNIFDTQIAASFLGYDEQISYQKLVEKILDIELDKKERISDWTNRPLSKKQLIYALNDVKYLHELYKPLSEKLSQEKKSDWMNEEMKLCVNNIFEKSDKQEDNYSILYKKIYDFREEIAQKKNVPRKWVFEDKIIRDFITSKDRENLVMKIKSDFIDLSEKTNLYNFIEIYLQNNRIINNIRKKKLSSTQNKLLSRISTYLDKTSIMYNVSRGLISNRKDIEEIILNDDPYNKSLFGWRKEIFGNNALIIKNGENL
tara:strand:- start:4042 stop:5148 length:1107 start_codon:yes stop_codon:yes gene_type:complete